MKKIVLVGGLVVVIAIVSGIYAALHYGETSTLYAEGNVSLATELQSEASGIRTVFVTIFDADSGMPMPYGAMRETLGTDPAGKFLEFTLTPERMQLMNPSAPLPKMLRIKARLDRDGLGGMDQPGDLVGEVTRVALGSTGVAIAIDRKIE